MRDRLVLIVRALELFHLAHWLVSELPEHVHVIVQAIHHL